MSNLVIVLELYMLFIQLVIIIPMVHNTCINIYICINILINFKGINTYVRTKF